LATEDGPVSGRFLVACAGLQSDRLARRTGSDPGARIVPFRGEYLDLVGHSADLVSGLVYPVPDPRFPFLGVHLTRGLDGHVHAGPNAVLSLAREGYGRCAVSPRDLFETLAWPGTARLVGRYWRPGLGELRRSLSRRRFAQAARRLVPDLDPADFRRAPSGIRAQALDRSGALLDDFHLVDGERAVHVVNAPSPAATASLAIGEVIAERVLDRIASR
jgi:L-2-hydroxyglutarate oxidase